MLEHTPPDGALDVDLSFNFGTVPFPGDNRSAQGREAPVGRSIWGRGHFGS